MMNFWQAIEAIDHGYTVKKVYSPLYIYKLSKDGESIVRRAIDDPEDEWRQASFYSSHIRGEWEIAEGCE